MSVQRHPPDHPERIHADPYPPDLLPLERVRRLRDDETREELHSGRQLALVLALAWMLALIAIVAIVWLVISTPRADPDARPSPAALTGPGLPGAPTAAGLSSTAVERTVAGTPLRGWATYCAPTPTRCQRWGEPAMLGAVRSFRWGDDPYMVQVCAFPDGTTVCTHVQVVSFCACGDRRGIPTVIDLSPAAFKELTRGDLGPGVIRVEVSSARIPLPPTGTEP